MDKENQLQRLRQIGFSTKGGIYILLGALAALAAFNLGGEVSDQKGIMRVLLDFPGGKILVGATALGLCTYTLWRFYLAYADPRGEDQSQLRRYGIRLQYIYSGLFYGSIAFSFIRALFGKFSSGEEKQQAMLGRVLEMEAGPWLIGALAAMVAGQALFQGYLAFTGNYMIQIDDHPGSTYRWVKVAGRVGYYARLVLFAGLAYLLVRVIIEHNADAYKGTTGVFYQLQSMDFGNILMALTALGLLVYGVFCVLVARYSNMSKLL